MIADGSVGETTRQGEPVFIVGCERSGSTLLRLMLDHHPSLAFPHQFEFAVDRVGDDGSLPELASYHRYLESSAIFRRSGFVADPELDYRALQESFLEQGRRGRPVVGGSIHRHFRRILHLWPEARLIHLLRDPRPVARSIAQMGWAGNSWAGAAWWVEAEREWERVARELPPERWLEVRYEALVSEPEATLGRTCAFLGVPYDARMLEYPADSTYGAPEPSLADRWRKGLPERERRRIEARVGTLMEARGYAPGAPRPIALGRAERARLLAEDRLGRVRFALGRYGGWLSAQRWLANRVGSERFRRRVRERLQRIDARYVR